MGDRKRIGFLFCLRPNRARNRTADSDTCRRPLRKEGWKKNRGKKRYMDALFRSWSNLSSIYPLPDCDLQIPGTNVQMAFQDVLFRACSVNIYIGCIHAYQWRKHRLYTLINITLVNRSTILYSYKCGNNLFNQAISAGNCPIGHVTRDLLPNPNHQHACTWESEPNQSLPGPNRIRNGSAKFDFLMLSIHFEGFEGSNTVLRGYLDSKFRVRSCLS
jgi:hypothetical protein